MTELERKLLRLGAEIDYPPTPPLAGAVAQSLEREGTERSATPARWRPLTARASLLAIALLLLLAGGVVAAIPATRHAVLDLVGLRGATVERVPALPDNVRAQLGRGLGEPSTLESAPHSLSFRPLLPDMLGEPNGVFVSDVPPGGELSLTYGPQPGLPQARYTGVGLLVNEIDADFAPGFFGKMVPRGVQIERLQVAGHPAVWVKGLHEFLYLDAEHNFRTEKTRLAGNTLLVQVGPIMVRIEGRFGLRGAMEIAESLR